MDLPAGSPLSREDWEHTLLSVQAVLIMLGQENQILKQQAFELQKQVNVLQSEVEQQPERTGKYSSNSSKPPSSDPPLSEMVFYMPKNFLHFDKLFKLTLSLG